MLLNKNQSITHILCRRDLVSFVMGAFKIVSPNDKYIHSWYIELICEYLLNCQSRDIKRLIINIPPRHMKSLIVNVMFPAWLIGHNPTETILTATYSFDLHKKHAMLFLRLLQSEWYQQVFPEVIVEGKAKEFITTTKGGYRYSTTVSGQLTGSGGNYIIIDDPLNAKFADSMIARQKVIDWYSFSLSTRQNQKDTVMVLIAQRLHEEDLPGFLIEQGNWQLLKLPAIAEEDETFSINNKTYSRKIGDVLSPERFGIEFYEAQRKELREYAFAGQYQQRPAPIGGGELKAEWLQYYDGHLNIKDFTIFILCDPAGDPIKVKKKKSDYTAIAVIGLGADKNIYILDMTVDRLNIYQRKDELFFLHNKYTPTRVGYEEYSISTDIAFLTHCMNEQNYRFAINPVGGIISKTDRIRRIGSFLQDKRIWVPRQLTKYTKEGTRIDLVKILIEQLMMFPSGIHDDLLDCISRIFDLFPNQTLIFPNTKFIDSNRLNKIVK